MRGQAATLADGIDKAFEVIAQGAARQQLERFIGATKRYVVQS